MVLVALVLVAVGVMPRPTAAGSGGLALGLAVVPALALLLATIIGLATGVSGVALIVRNHLDGRGSRAAARATSGRDLRLGRSLRTAVRSAPKVVLACAAGAVVVAVLVAAAPVLVLAAAGVAVWKAVREKSSWRRTLRSLGWAVPFAPAAAAAAAVPAVYASVLNGAPLREAVRAAVRSSLRSRVTTLVGLVVVIAVGGLLAQVALAGKVVGGTAFDVAIVISLLVAGAALGALAHTGSATADPGSPGSGVTPRRGAPAGRSWRLAVRRARLSRVAGVTAVSLVAPVLALGAVVVPATAARAATDVVVDTAADASTTVDPDQCRTAGVPCGLRAAVAYAGEQAAADGSTVTVTFATDTTIRLAGTLKVPSGVAIDGGNNAVTIDAGHGFRAIEAYSAGGEGPKLSLKHVRVTGGRSTPGGAGLYSGDVGVTLVETTWDDNVSGGAGGGSGSSPDGGAVALPANTLWVEDSTFADDHATAGGGGAMAANRVFVTNATITTSTGASGRAEGGALLATSGGQITHATVTAGGGIAGTTGMPLEVVNTLASTVSGSLACAQITSADPAAGSPSVGNVDPDGTCLGVAADPVPLGALADNGGPTQTMALAAGNPALAAGSADYCALADQRGTGRDAQQCDAGAFQLSQPAPPPSTVVTLSGDRYSYIQNTVGLYVTAAQDGTGQAGSVVLLEGGTQVAGPFTLNPLLDKTAIEFDALPQGPHQLVARFTPDDGSAAIDSEPFTLSIASLSQAVLSTQQPAALHQPVTIVATITDRPDYGSVGVAEPGTPVRTGTATLTVNGVDHQVTLVNGTATLYVDDLQSSTVSVFYSGDDYYYPTDNLSTGGWSADITAVDTATTTTADVVRAEYGQPLTVAATVNDASGPADGTVTLYLDGAAKDTQTLAAGQATLSTSAPAGDHDLYVAFTPASGWALSQSVPVTVHVAPARTSVTISAAAPSVVYPAQPAVGFDATGTGAADLQLKDADTVVATAHVTLPATGQFTLLAGSLAAGTYHLHAEVVPSATAAASSSNAVDVTLTTGTTAVTATADGGAVVGSPTTVHLSADASALTTYTVTRDGDGSVVDVVHSTDGTGSFDYTPLVADVALTVTATFDDGNYGTAVAHVTITATKVAAPAPTMTWHNPGPDFDAAPPYLTLTLPTTAGLPAPTGHVQLLGRHANDLVSDIIGYGDVVDGTVRIDYIGAPGVCYCGDRTPRLQYAGDGTYLGFDAAAPEVDVPAIATTTTLSGVPATVRPGNQLLLQAHTQATSGIPTGRIDFVVNGAVVVSKDLVSGSIGTMWTVPWDLGDHAEVTARFVPDSTTWQASNGSQSATVLYPQPPTVTLEAPDQLKAGDWGHVVLHVEQFDQFIDAGSPITVTDGAGDVLATTYWWGSATAGTAAPVDLTIKPVHGGPSQFFVHYVFNGGTGGVSAPLSTTVDGVTTHLLVEPDPAPVAGYPFSVRVSLGGLPAGVQAGVLPVQLYADGVPFGFPQYAYSTGTEPPSAVFYGSVAKRGFVSFSATTVGDGADLGAGIGGSTVLVAGAPLHLSARDGIRYEATFGKALTITPQFSWGATTGSGPTDGRLTVALVGDDGTSRTCEAQLPALKCTFASYAVPAPGTYSVRVSYSGGSFYADTPADGPGDGSGGTSVGQLVVSGTRSTLATTFDRNPLTWVVGQRVTATFDVADPLDDTLLATGFVTLRAGETTLCSTRVDHARRTTCAFTVPDPQQPLAQQKPSDLVGTFTSDGPSLPGSSWAQLGPLPRCFLVTSTYGNMPGARHVPAVSGRTCDTAGAAPGHPGTMPGYLEGSAVDLTLVDPVTSGWKYTGSQATYSDGTTQPQQLIATGKTVTVWNLSQDVSVTPQYRWDPTCVTVVTGFESSVTPVGMTLGQWRQYNHGEPDPANGLRLTTPSNCDQPSGSSAREIEDLKNGIGHYVIGTDLYGGRSHPGPDPAPQKVQWDIVEVPGGTAPAAGGSTWHAKATGPNSGSVQIVFGRFRWSAQMCRPLQLEPGEGGTLAVTGSHFPAGWSEFDGASGTCTTPSGQHGYFAGTDVEVTATPASRTNGTRIDGKPNYYLYRWLTAADLAGSGSDPYAMAFQPRWALYAKARTEVPGTTGNVTGDPYAAHTTSRTMPFDATTPTVVGAEYGVLSCVPVMVNLHDFPGATHVNMTPTNCPGITPDNDGSRGAHRADATTYYTYNTHVEVSTDAPSTHNGKAMSWTGRYDGGEWSWENESTAAIKVPYALDGVTLDASYFDVLCFKRQDGLEQVDANGYGSRVNADRNCLPGWTKGGATQRAIIPPAAQANHVKAEWRVSAARQLVSAGDYEIRNLDPTTHEVGFPVVVDSNLIAYADLDQSYTSGGKTVPRFHQTRVDLRFCRDLSDVVTTRIVDPNGHPMSWGSGEFGHAPDAQDVMKTQSGCYGLATEPGSKDAVRLTDAAQKKWTLLAWRNTTTGRMQLNTPQSYGMAFLSSTDDGVVSTSWEAIVTPRCYTLDYSERVNVNTAPNCAGVDPNLHMYNPGTVVHVSWDSGHDDSWGGWDGASGGQGDGTVVMDQDRTVRATWTHDDNFKTNILNPLSNTAQRVVGAIVTGFNSWLLEPAAAVLSVVQKVATVCNLVASGLEMLGVHGAAIDGLKSVSAAIGSSIDMLNALGSCTVQWATGDAQAMTPTTTEGKAAKAAAGAIAKKVSASVGNDWMKDASVGVDLVTLFSGNLDSFSQDPKAAWSSITGIGSCLQEKAETAAGNFGG